MIILILTRYFNINFIETVGLKTRVKSIPEKILIFSYRSANYIFSQVNAKKLRNVYKPLQRG